MFPGHRCQREHSSVASVFPVERNGERLRLREWTVGEAEGVHRWLGNPLVNRFLSWGTSTLEESDAHLLAILAAQRARPRTEFFLAIEGLDSLEVTIGDAGFT